MLRAIDFTEHHRADDAIHGAEDLLVERHWVRSGSPARLRFNTSFSACKRELVRRAHFYQLISNYIEQVEVLLVAQSWITLPELPWVPGVPGSLDAAHAEELEDEELAHVVTDMLAVRRRRRRRPCIRT